MKYYLVSYKEGKFGSPIDVYRYHGFFDTIETAQERLNHLFSKHKDASWSTDSQFEFRAINRTFSIASAFSIRDARQ